MFPYKQNSCWGGTGQTIYVCKPFNYMSDKKGAKIVILTI